MSDTESKPRYDPSCLDDYDPDSLSVEHALRQILLETKAVTEQETIPIKKTLGRTLAEEIKAPLAVPGHTNSAMDGYAVRADNLPESGQRTLKLIGTTLAGHPFEGRVSNGECVRIMTGAPMPRDCDTVVIQEHAKVDQDLVTIGADNTVGQNVREAGEDIALGQTVLETGKSLLPADIGLLASLGITEVTVKRQITVAFFSTGDELTPSGEPLGPGQIYDSNRYILHTLLLKLGVKAVDIGIVKDTPEATSKAFQQAMQQADVIITSGGVSVGDADFVKNTVSKLGHIHFWKVAVKPGRPLAFGHLNNTLYFGLPGNPVSVMITFYILVRPALQKMMGQTPKPPLTMKVPCTDNLRKRKGRTEYQRGILKREENGEYSVSKTGAQGSGILSSMSTANCLIVLPETAGDIEANTIVEVIPFESIV